MTSDDLYREEIRIAKEACNMWTPQPTDIMQVVYRDWGGNIMAATLTEHQCIDGRAICSREPDWVTGNWGVWRWES